MSLPGTTSHADANVPSPQKESEQRERPRDEKTRRKKGVNEPVTKKKTKLQIGCLAAMGGVFLLFLILYITLSTHVEYTLSGEHFRVRDQGEQLVLTGRLRDTRGTVTATPTQEGMDFAFDFSPYFSQTYHLTLGEETTITQRYTDSEGTLLSEEPTPVRPITVTDGEGTVLLDAFYQDVQFRPFLDENGAPLEDDLGFFQIYGSYTNPALNWEGFEPPLWDMAELAAGDSAPAHREVPWGIFVLFTLFGVVLSLVIAFPMAWFRLNFFLSVVDPEPTDWYLFTMKIGWVASPLVLAVFYAIGLFTGR